MSIKDVALQPTLAVTGQLEMFKSCSSHFIAMCQATATAVFWALSSTEMRKARGNKKESANKFLVMSQWALRRQRNLAHVCNPFSVDQVSDLSSKTAKPSLLVVVIFAGGCKTDA